MTLVRSNIFVTRISYASEWDHILNSNSEDILLLMVLIIYIYIYIRKLCTQLRRKERKKKGASHVFPSSLPNHIWGLSSSFPSPFSSYIYIYIYIHTKEKKKKKLCTKLRRERRRRKGASHVFPSSLLYTFESSHLLLLSPLLYIYIYLHINKYIYKYNYKYIHILIYMNSKFYFLPQTWGMSCRTQNSYLWSRLCQKKHAKTKYD